MALRNELSKDEFIALFEENSKNSFVDEKLMKEATNHLKKHNFPSKGDEEWKHTSIKKILQHKYYLGKNLKLDKSHVNLFTIPGLDAYRLVYINGFYSKEFSDEILNKKGLIIQNIADAKNNYPDLYKKYFESTGISKENLFTSANTAYSFDGAFISVPNNLQLDKPIHIINFSDGAGKKTISQYRNLIIAGKNSNVQIVNSSHSLTVNYTLTNISTEIIVEDNAFLNYNIFQGEGDDAFQINNTRVNQAANSNFSSHTITLCGSIVRNDLKIEHQGENCETNLFGLYLPDREQHFDNNVFINHAKPNCRSNQVYKGIIDNKASAVFLGKVLVAKDAQKTFADQTNRNILLTKYAKVYSKPQLEIYADDVSCSHGSTTGQIDKEALFYLQTRGINKRRSEILLLGAFIADVIDEIKVEPLKIFVNILINSRLRGEKVSGQCAMEESCAGCDTLE